MDSRDIRRAVKLRAQQIIAGSSVQLSDRDAIKQALREQCGDDYEKVLDAVLTPIGGILLAICFARAYEDDLELVKDLSDDVNFQHEARPIALDRKRMEIGE